MFGEKLKKLRENENLTQAQFAKKFGLLKSSISMYENNIRLPSVEVIKEIAKYFNVSIDYLLGNETSSNKDEELKNKEALKKALQNSGFMESTEDLSDEELDKIMKFINANKEFLKDNK